MHGVNLKRGGCKRKEGTRKGKRRREIKNEYTGDGEGKGKKYTRPCPHDVFSSTLYFVASSSSSFSSSPLSPRFFLYLLVSVTDLRGTVQFEIASKTIFTAN